jgi:uncharacterized protein
MKTFTGKNRAKGKVPFAPYLNKHEMKNKNTIKVFIFLISFLFLVIPFSGNDESALAASLEVNTGGISFQKKVKTFKDLKFQNIVRQTLDYSCGAASLATILTYYFGKETAEDEILNSVFSHADSMQIDRIKQKGLSLLDLKNYGESLGYKVKGYKLPDHHLLTKLKMPAIALIDHKGISHFVVIKGTVGEDVFIADPARGNMIIRLKEFGGIWENTILVCYNPDGEKIKSSSLSLKYNTHKRTILSNQVNTDLSRFITRGSLEFH